MGHAGTRAQAPSSGSVNTAGAGKGPSSRRERFTPGTVPQRPADSAGATSPSAIGRSQTPPLLAPDARPPPRRSSDLATHARNAGVTAQTVPQPPVPCLHATDAGTNPNRSESAPRSPHTRTPNRQGGGPGTATGPRPSPPHQQTPKATNPTTLEIAVMSQTQAAKAALNSSFAGFQLARGQEELTAR